jgi:methylated-DNA-[protein]-cysteine S-methyltransferase
MPTVKATYLSPLGPMLATGDGDAVTGLWFLGQSYFPDSADSLPQDESPVLGRLFDWLDAYFAGSNPAVDFTLSATGTPFRERVWRQLRDIPYGETTTYGAIAQRLSPPGRRLSARAVGGAVGHNPISLVIPCHRVVGADGSLTGYGAGLDKKTALLKLEGIL